MVGITCGPLLPGGSNTELVPDELDYLEVYTYTCLPGYVTNKTACVVCLPDGNLSMVDPPDCESEYLLLILL